MIKTNVRNFYPSEGSKTVLIFGGSQTGKSTLVNLLTGASEGDEVYLPEGGDRARGCSFETTIVANIPFQGHIVNLIDTAGLNEADNGQVNGT